MVFSSLSFLYYFLPCVLIIYFIVPERMKNVVLLLFSLLFYGLGEPRMIVHMLIMIAVGYLAGVWMEKYSAHKKKILYITCIYCVGTLVFFKFENELPIGISFYTFQILSYVIDVYRGEVPAQKSLLNLATYVAMFPQLIAGPIVRYQHVEEQLHSRQHGIDKAANGIRRFVLGLSKKVLLANTFGEVCVLFAESTDKSVLFYWMCAVAFTLQIYFDFSGYSDMAIGLGKIFGFDFMENFRYPYTSKSITEFWRRWHISLGTWFRDYVYIPLGGSKKWYALFVVWTLTGIWHGAEWNFLVWGLYFAVLLLIERKWLRKHLEKSKICGRVYVMLLVIISFVIFQAPSLAVAMHNLGGMFGVLDVPLLSSEALYYLKSYGGLFLIGMVGATEIPKKVTKKLPSMMEPIALILLLVGVTAYLVDGSYNPFLYFRF